MNYFILDQIVIGLGTAWSLCVLLFFCLICFTSKRECKKCKGMLLLLLLLVFCRHCSYYVLQIVTLSVFLVLK